MHAIFQTNGSKQNAFPLRVLLCCAACIALSCITSFFSFASLPFGGSITLFSMFFISFLGSLYGLRVGIISGITYGLLQFLIKPFFFHPLQMILDYPLAFGSLGLSGLFYKQKYAFQKGYCVGVFFRYLCHVVSGYLFFASYAPKQMNPLLYTLGYNATYIVPEALATLILICLPIVSHTLSHLKETLLQCNH